MSIRATAVGILLLVGCASLVMSRLMRRAPSILATPLALTRWMIFIFSFFRIHLLLSLLHLLVLHLLDLVRLLHLRRHPLLRLVPLVLLVLRLRLLLLLFLLPLLLMSYPLLMSLPIHGLFVSVVLQTVILLLS